ncbi:MAG TPA: hypothetical protein VK835_10285 [Bacteroidia bacterium]|jgi:hypothetical protein|nr:hypothetical protein [Bacteroidia bacterium]
MAFPIKHYNKIFIFIYILFASTFYGWFYFDGAYDACAGPNFSVGTNSNCFIYKDGSNFCFLAWIVTLIVLAFFIFNSLATKGLRVLKMPTLAILITAVLFLLAEFFFGTIFKG